MQQQGFEINITKDSVDVRRNVSFLTQRYGTYVGVAYVALAILIFYWLVLYSPHGQISLWETVREGPITHTGFGEVIFELVPAVSLPALIFCAFRSG